MAPNPLKAYKDNSVTTQTPGQIVVLLYEGAIRFCRQAITALEQKDYIQKGKLLDKAYGVVAELNASLDMEKGGEVALNLRKLYVFMQEQLVEANFKKDTKRVQQVIGLLEELLGAWKQVAA